MTGSDPGAATRMKLIINMVMGTVVASLSEGMAMAEKVGLDLEDVAEVLSLGSLKCPTIVHKSQGKVKHSQGMKLIKIFCLSKGMVKQPEKCITDFNISTCPASKTTSLGDRTSGNPF